MTSEKEKNTFSGALSEVEHIKIESRGLYQPLATELGENTPSFSESAIQVLKHHGAYQQDDRDIRLQRRKLGLDGIHTMMVRTKFPGGRLNAAQYLLCDDLCDRYGQGDMRATSRQDFQFHGVVKKDLRPLIHDLNLLGKMCTLGGCGDVVRNTMAPPVANIDARYRDCGADLLALADTISQKTFPTTKSYFDLWLNDEKVVVEADGTCHFSSEAPEPVADPLYQGQYLPRKFKVGIATDFDNSVDVFTQDFGLIATTLPQYGGGVDGKIVGFEVVVGGGLGHAHTKPNTYPRLATPFAFVSEAEVWPLLEAVIQVQRDFGNREDRKQARLKYTIDRLGWERFGELVRQYAGRSFDPPRRVVPVDQPDYLGWRRQHQEGLNYVGVWVENGRIRDIEGGIPFKTGLRKVIEKFQPEVRVTPHHNLILAGIADKDVAAVQALLDAYQLPTDTGISTLRRKEMACPALPLCPLAQSESERVMPQIMRQIEEAGLGDADVILRMTGCPNGCARSTVAEIGMIGKGPGRYTVHIAGAYNGTRLNQVFRDKVAFEELAPLLIQLIGLWKEHRLPEERFGDWSARLGIEKVSALL